MPMRVVSLRHMAEVEERETEKNRRAVWKKEDEGNRAGRVGGVAAGIGEILR